MYKKLEVEEEARKRLVRIKGILENENTYKSAYQKIRFIAMNINQFNNSLGPQLNNPIPIKYYLSTKLYLLLRFFRIF
jgi:hypothetical protein